MNVKTIVLLAAILGGTGVMMGAFGAHFLERLLGGQELTAGDLQKRKDWLEIGTRYQMYHAAALLGLAALAHVGTIPNYKIPAILLIVGTIIFSGCLHAMALTGIKVLGAIVPIGGALQIIGWAWLAVAALKSS